MHQPAINLVGDCFADIKLAQTSLLGVQHIASALRKADLFREVLATKNQISIQYDPLRFTPEQVEDALRQQLQIIDTRAAVKPTAQILIPIIYDGPDLHTVADHLGLTPTSFIARHLATTFEVEMLGFTPGFAYLSNELVDWMSRAAPPRAAEWKPGLSVWPLTIPGFILWPGPGDGKLLAAPQSRFLIRQQRIRLRFIQRCK